MTPIAPMFADWESREEWIEERAAILEHEAGYDRATAERLAKKFAVAMEAAHAPKFDPSDPRHGITERIRAAIAGAQTAQEAIP